MIKLNGIMRPSRLFLVTLWIFSAQLCLSIETIRFVIQDDTPAYVFIGNIKQSANLRLNYTDDILQTLTFQFLEEGRHQRYIHLNGSAGDLTTKIPVDREELCSGEAICIIPINIAIQPREHFRLIKSELLIIDRNDHNPQFEQNSFRFEILESTAPGVIGPVLTASDPDSPAFGVQRYLLLPDTDVFSLSIRNTSGTFDLQLNLLKELDRETQDTYRLRVLASDGGQPARTGTLTLDVHILDVNDNSPVFESNINEVTVPENLTPGSVIFTVLAVDADSGQNGDVFYQFNWETNEELGAIFSIDSYTGQVRLERHLDYETRTSYSLVITANDEGQDSLPTNTRLVVHVNDINDNHPYILNNTLPDDRIVLISENNNPSSFVAHISVVDLDSGSNGRVECFLSGDEGRFDIIELYEKEFKIIAMNPLDYEQETLYNLRIRCQDYGIPPYDCEERLQVRVQDVNDNPPEFTEQTYRVSLPENNAPHTSLIRLSASDVDTGSGGDVRYSLPQNARPLFEVDERTGHLWTMHSLDREHEAVIELEVIASDRGDPSLSSTATVTIELIDVNDDAPTFTSRMYRFNISENMPANSLVGTVHAIDMDAAPHNELSYFLVSQHSAVDTFLIHPDSGNIFTKRELDREERDSYTLVVLAQNPNFPDDEDSCMVEIQVVDINDNVPIIAFPRPAPDNVVTISNRAPSGYHITTARATDKDASANGLLEYEIFEGNEEGLFRLNFFTGDLFLTTDIEPLVMDNERYSLTITVRDQGFPVQMAVASLDIVINSSAPIINDRIHDNGNSEAIGKTDTDSTSIIVGTICGFVIIILLVVLMIILILRNRNKDRTNQPLYTTQPSSPSKADVLDFRTQSRINEHIKETNLSFSNEESPMKTSASFDQPTKDQTFIPIAKPAQEPRNGCGVRGSEEKDSDSGCADLSQGSSEDTNIQVGATLKITKSDDGNSRVNDTRSNEISLTTFTTSQEGNPRFAIRQASIERVPQRRNSDFMRSLSEGARTSMSSPPYLHYSLTPPRGSPSPILMELSPNKSSSFAKWLQNENRQLQTQGNRYNVNSNKPPVVPGGRIPTTPKSGKTVRFIEPERSSLSSGEDHGICDTEETTPRSTPPVCIKASFGQNARYVLDLTNTDTNYHKPPVRKHPVVQYPMEAYSGYQIPEEDGSLV